MKIRLNKNLYTKLATQYPSDDPVFKVASINIQKNARRYFTRIKMAAPMEGVRTTHHLATLKPGPSLNQSFDSPSETTKKPLNEWFRTTIEVQRTIYNKVISICEKNTKHLPHELMETCKAHLAQMGFELNEDDLNQMLINIKELAHNYFEASKHVKQTLKSIVEENREVLSLKQGQSALEKPSIPIQKDAKSYGYETEDHRLSIVPMGSRRIADVSIDYGTPFGRVDYYHWSRQHGYYPAVEVLEVSADHSHDELVGEFTCPELITRASKRLAGTISEYEQTLKKRTLRQASKALTPMGQQQPLNDVAIRFNRKNLFFIEYFNPVNIDLRCFNQNGFTQFETDHVLTGNINLFQLFNPCTQTRYSVVLTKLPGLEKAFELNVTSQIGEGNTDFEQSELEQKLYALIEKVISDLQIGTYENTLSINLSDIIEGLQDAWAINYPALVWHTQGFDDYQINLVDKDRCSMFTQITIGARNKQLHYTEILESIGAEESINSKNLEFSQRYAEDGKVADRFCDTIIQHVVFRSAFERFRAYPHTSKAECKPYERVKFRDLKGAMNMLFHHLISKQVSSFSDLEFFGSAKNRAVFLLKTSLQDMFQKNMRSIESYALKELYRQEKSWFLDQLSSFLNDRLFEMVDKGDVLLTLLPITQTSIVDPMFDNNRRLNIEILLDMTFASYDRYVMERPYVGSGNGDDSPTFLNALTRNAKPYTALGNRTIVEFRSSCIRSKSIPAQPSNTFLSRS